MDLKDLFTKFESYGYDSDEVEAALVDYFDEKRC